jgi:hypothetical protein
MPTIDELRKKIRRVLPGQVSDDYNQLFDTPQGERVLRDICKRGKVFRSCFAGARESSDYLLGRRDLALEILRLSKTPTSELLSMMEQSILDTQENPLNE